MSRGALASALAVEIPLPLDAGEDLPARAPACLPGPLIRAEANLLRFPLFALHTKGLKSLDGIECSGRMTRGGETYQFTYRATRNTATLYPGPLARSAHLAFLGMLSEGGSPVLHPLTWTWRDLCRRLDITPSGQMVTHLKHAITATAGLLIQSDLAFYSKPDDRLIRTEQQALHLYERVVFAGMMLPDGRKAEENCLWLADWYRANLDAFFSAPLDYALWKYLEDQSPIASRLYEFLLVNLYGPAPVLRINYETLVPFLPVRPEKYLSAAERQLSGALQLLRDTAVLGEVEWRETRSGIAMLAFHRGPRLQTMAKKGDLTPLLSGDEAAETVQVKELRNLKPPEWHLVAGFYASWANRPHITPTSKELAQARELIAAHGQTRANDIVRAAIKHLKKRFPAAKTFGAVTLYVDDAVKDVRRREKQAAQTHAERESSGPAISPESSEFVCKAQWDALPEADREQVRRKVLATQPKSLEKYPQLLERLCYEELKRRSSRAGLTA